MYLKIDTRRILQYILWCILQRRVYSDTISHSVSVLYVRYIKCLYAHVRRILHSHSKNLYIHVCVLQGYRNIANKKPTILSSRIGIIKFPRFSIDERFRFDTLIHDLSSLSTTWQKCVFYSLYFSRQIFVTRTYRRWISSSIHITQRKFDTRLIIKT